MSQAEYTGEDDEVSVLSYEMQQRVEALRAARRILERRTVQSGGIFSAPTIEPGETIDLFSLASWIVTGDDPWAAPPRDESLPVVLTELLDLLRKRSKSQLAEDQSGTQTGTQFLARLREQSESYGAPYISRKTLDEWLAEGPTGAKVATRNAADPDLWRQPDPITPDERERMAAAAAESIWPNGHPGAHPVAETEPEKDENLVEAGHPCRHLAAPPSSMLDQLSWYRCRDCGELLKDLWVTVPAGHREKEDVPIPFVGIMDDRPIPYYQTAEGKAAIKQAYEDFA